MSELTIDQQFLLKAQSDAKKTRIIGVLFIIGGGLFQLLHLITVSIRGFKWMVIIAGVILAGSGVLFILGSYTVPRNRSEFIKRFQGMMLDDDPETRLQGAQMLIGYLKQANLTKDELLRITRYTAGIVQDPPVADRYKQYIAGDHLLLLRELAVTLDMDRHTRKDFVRLIRPLKKMDNLTDEAYELLADAIAYHPDKKPFQAYLDLQRDQEDE